MTPAPCDGLSALIWAASPRVEHVGLVIKGIFGWANVRHQELAKTIRWLQNSCGLANLCVTPQELLAQLSHMAMGSVDYLLPPLE